MRAVIAESYERIHRSNLIGMGVLPLRFHPGDRATAYGFTGEEELSFDGFDALRVGANDITLRIRRPDGTHDRTTVGLQLYSRQELTYLRHGGILPYGVRRSLGAAQQ